MERWIVFRMGTDVLTLFADSDQNSSRTGEIFGEHEHDQWFVRLDRTRERLVNTFLRPFIKLYHFL